jgi:hypothetical protein
MKDFKRGIYLLQWEVQKADMEVGVGRAMGQQRCGDSSADSWSHLDLTLTAPVHAR